jgi:hypothetical protein
LLLDGKPVAEREEQVAELRALRVSEIGEQFVFGFALRSLGRVVSATRTAATCA